MYKEFIEESEIIKYMSKEKSNKKLEIIKKSNVEINVRI